MVGDEGWVDEHIHNNIKLCAIYSIDRAGERPCELSHTMHIPLSEW